MAFSLACIVLRNEELQNELQQKEGFEYSDVLYLLHSTDKVIPLQNIRAHLEENGLYTTLSNYNQNFFMKILKCITKGTKYKRSLCRSLVYNDIIIQLHIFS